MLAFYERHANKFSVFQETEQREMPFIKAAETSVGHMKDSLAWGVAIIQKGWTLVASFSLGFTRESNPTEDRLSDYFPQFSQGWYLAITFLGTERDEVITYNVIVVLGYRA